MVFVKRHGRVLVAGGVAVIVLAGASTVALANVTGGFGPRWGAPSGQCSAPPQPGSPLNVALADMGGRMGMGGGGSNMGGMMRIHADKRRVPTGTISLRVANTGSLVHELIVLPLPAGQRIGSRRTGPDGRVDETGSVAEVSRTCGSGAGDGINPGALGWDTVELKPGRYELICNLAGHYGSGMYTELVVT